MKRWQSLKEPAVGLNMTPLIDMVFILLVFFVVNTSFVKNIDAPQAAIDSDGPYLGGIALKVPGFIMAHDLIAILRRPPPYPRLLKRRGIEGYALVEFTVTEQGLVQDPVIVESHPHEDFGKSVMRSVRYWRFKPYRIDDQPVAVRARQGIDFTME
jgi:TonB family protein